MEKSLMIPREKRARILKETTASLERGTPDNVLLRKIIIETGYTIHGAKGILQEAKLFVEKGKK